MNKRCYQYDSNNIYIGRTIAFNGNLPQNTTFIEPLECKKGFVQVFDGSKFEYIEDHRGEQGFLNNESFTIKEIGEYPQGWSKDYVKNDAEILAEEIAKIDAQLLALDNEALQPSLRAQMASINGEVDTIAIEKLKDIEARKEPLRARKTELTKG